MAGEARVTQLGVLAELEPDSAVYVTQVAVLAELEPDSVLYVTQVAVLAEMDAAHVGFPLGIAVSDAVVVSEIRQTGIGSGPFKILLGGLEDISLTDVATAVNPVGRGSTSDPIVVSESVSVSPNYSGPLYVSVSDSTGVAESVSAARQLPLVSVGDVALASDSAAVIVVPVATLAVDAGDSAVADDSPAALVPVDVAASDAVASDESLIVLPQGGDPLAVAQDAVTADESVGLSVWLEPATEDHLTAGDATVDVQVSPVALEALAADTITTSDTVALAPLDAYLVDVSEQATAADVATVEFYVPPPPLEVLAGDTLVSSDAVFIGALVAYLVDVADSAVVEEFLLTKPIVTGERNIARFDGIGSSESTKFKLANYIQVDDAIVVEDVVTPKHVFKVRVSDAITHTEAMAARKTGVFGVYWYVID